MLGENEVEGQSANPVDCNMKVVGCLQIHAPTGELCLTYFDTPAVDFKRLIKSALFEQAVARGNISVLRDVGFGNMDVRLDRNIFGLQRSIVCIKQRLDLIHERI